MRDFQPIGIPQQESVEISDELEKVVASRDELREKVKENIRFSNPIVERNGFGIIYMNTINVIQGKAGAHKSRLMELLCSCIISERISDKYVGFKRYALNSIFTLLYVDTERNTKDQFPFALQQIIRMAGFFQGEQPDHFDFISLIEVARDNRLEILQLYIGQLRRNNDGHIIIVLDVITDLVSNFNDPRESMKLIDYMNSLINTQDVTFICIIHENPSSGDKARGHLGTEIMNKASLQIQIGFEKTKNNEDTDLIKIKYLKTRVGKRPEPFHLVYSDTKKSLVVADGDYVANMIDKKKHVAYVDEVIQRLLEILRKPMSRSALTEDLITFFECSKNTVLDRLHQINVNQMPMKDKEGTVYTLAKRKEGRETIYYLSDENEKLEL